MNLRVNLEGRLKLLFSLSLLIYATVVASIFKNFWLALAMLTSTWGDIAIMASRGVFNNEKWKNSFNIGVVMFGAAHCLYIASMSTKYSTRLLIIAILALIGVTIMAHQAIANGKKVERIMMAIYAITLIINMLNGFSYNILAGIGGILFIASDAILGIFEKKSPKWQLAIWGTYVPAQICLISSFLIN